jgi:anthranilate/para-aminobenzoate synthase component I
LRADEARTAKIRELIPSVQVRSGVCHLSIEAEEPAEVAEKARVLLEKLRAAM